MENKYRKLLKIPSDRLKAINEVMLGDTKVINAFLDVVAKYGTPEEINRKHRAARKLSNLFKLVDERNPAYIQDLNWLIEQRNHGAFVSVADYRKNLLGNTASAMKFKDK